MLGNFIAARNHALFTDLCQQRYVTIMFSCVVFLFIPFQFHHLNLFLYLCLLTQIFYTKQTCYYTFAICWLNLFCNKFDRLQYVNLFINNDETY